MAQSPLHQRLRRVLERRGISGYKQHRIVQIGGWGSVDMLRRYHGKLSTTELKRYPTTLAKYARTQKQIVSDDK